MRKLKDKKNAHSHLDNVQQSYTRVIRQMMKMRHMLIAQTGENKGGIETGKRGKRSRRGKDQR